MKNIVRAVVVALTFSGAVASTYTPTLSASVTHSGAGLMPIPCCPPDDPNACGIK